MVSLFHQQKSGEMTKMDQKIANLEEADRILSGAAGGAAAFFIYYGKNGFGSKNRRSMRDTGKYQRGYQGDTVAGGSSGHRDREEDYADSEVYITPTMKEIEELMEVRPEIIAMDATISKDPEIKPWRSFSMR